MQLAISDLSANQITKKQQQDEEQKKRKESGEGCLLLLLYIFPFAGTQNEKVKEEDGGINIEGGF